MDGRFIQQGLEKLAQAQAEQVKAYRERTELQGRSANADRQAAARTEALRIATEVHLAKYGSSIQMPQVTTLAEALTTHILDGGRLA